MIGDENGIVALLQLAFKKWPFFDLKCSSLDHWKWRYLNNPINFQNIACALNNGNIIGVNHDIPVVIKRLDEEVYEIGKRDLQDFVTKTWSLSTPMEEMEMNETHASFSRGEAKGLVKKAGLVARKLITFADIKGDLRLHNMSLESPFLPWDRKFILVSMHTNIHFF